MITILSTGYVELSLKETMDKLCSECYNKLEALCENTKKQADKLNSQEPQDMTRLYADFCSHIITEIEQCLASRRDIYIPYIQTLAEKAAANHNCSTCTGSCKMGHDIQLIELQGSHKIINDIFHRLQTAPLPLYSETSHPDEYRALRNQMSEIENLLDSLLSIENRYLIPKVIEAQKSINVAG